MDKIGLTTIIKKDEKHLRSMIKKCMQKEFHGSTKPDIDFINKLLEETYASGIVYDVSDMKSSVLTFAATSKHHAAYCIDLVEKMLWTSKPNKTSDLIIKEEN